MNDDRISWEPAPVHAGDTVKIKYEGILKNSGASDVFLHYGVDGWKNANTIKMQSEDGIFTASIPAQATHEVNFCFKDVIDNWDNNNGWNWSVNVI
jgi:hypothetical protein